MNEQVNLFFEWLGERKEQVLAEAKVLSGDGRIDESNSLKAKSNIYDICRAVCNAAEKQSQGAPLKDAFVTAFERVTAPWKLSLEQAKAHDDSRKVMIEEAKLSAVDEILAKIRESF